MLTVWSSSSSSAGSGMASSPKYRDSASKESSSFENAGLQRKGMTREEREPVSIEGRTQGWLSAVSWVYEPFNLLL